MMKVLVANKIDKAGQQDSLGNECRKVTEQMGKDMAEKYQMMYFEASAFSGEGVAEFFEASSYKFVENKINLQQKIDPIKPPEPSPQPNNAIMKQEEPKIVLGNILIYII